MSRVLRFVVVALSIGTVQLTAQDTVKTKSFVADFGVVNVAGNTSVTTINLADKFVANTRDKAVIFTQILGAVYGRTDGEKTVENYRAQLRLDYKLSGRLYLFGLAGWDRNTFGGVDRRFEETIGLAYRAIDRPQDQLDFEAGFSLFQQRNTVADNGSFDDNFKAGRLASFYKRTFRKSTVLTQNLEFMPNFDDGTDWRLNSETALVAPLSTNVGFRFAYVIRFDNLPGLEPPPNPTLERLKKTDRFLTAGITVSY